MINESHIPYQLIDVASNLLDKRNRNDLKTREEYLSRMNSIKKFVDESLREYDRRYAVTNKRKY